MQTKTKILNNKKHIDRQIELGYILQKKRADEFISFDEAQFSKFVSESGLQKTDVDDIENEEDFLRRNVAKSSIIAQYNKYGKNIVNFIEAVEQ